MKAFVLVLLLVGYSLATYDANEALNMVYASGLAYCHADNIMARQCGKATELTEQAGMTALHASDNGEEKNGITYTILERSSTNDIIVGFSGTRDTDQLITEILEAFPVDYSIHSDVADAKVFDYFVKHYVDGFRDDFMSAMSDILGKYPVHNVIFTGHSLGGAMTVHAAADFVLSNMQGSRQVRIYTYGQPRVGNAAFTDAVHGKVTEWYRLTHNQDIVAHIPPCISDLHDSCIHDGPLPFYPYHAPEEIYYDEPFENFIACSLSNGEDATCSNSNDVNDSVPDHLEYFHISIGGLSDLPASTEEKVEALLHAE